jgi:tyrosyl-tRNA synthetase
MRRATPLDTHPGLGQSRGMSSASPDPNFFEDLRRRGLVHQSTSPELAELLKKERVTAYIGFDPTSTSLHIGSLLPVTNLMRLQRAGHRPIAVVGGGTGLIGDPSGKAAERTLLTHEALGRNLAGLKSQLERFLEFDGPNAALMVDNYEWLGSMTMMEFLRDVGKHFSVNGMIARDAVRDRLENRDQGISYTEFSYILLQSYDFLALYDRYGCKLQMGGSDQWGNIVSGTDLIRRVRGAETYGLTQPLVLKSDGTKFGKSESGNVWLDAGMTSPYAMYQFLLNTDDADVVRYLKYFTFLDFTEIDAAEAQVASAPEKRHAQRLLAAEVVKLVHGEDALRRAERTTTALFGGGDWSALTAEDLEDAFAASPSSALPREKLGTPEASIVALIADAGLVPSRGQARQQVTGGGVSLNNVPVTDPNRVLGADDLYGDRFAVLRRGKKSWHVVRVS